MKPRPAPDFLRLGLMRPDWSRTYYIAEDAFELLTLLPLPAKCWVSNHAPSYPVYEVLRLEPRASCMLGEYWPHSLLGIFRTGSPSVAALLDSWSLAATS